MRGFVALVATAALALGAAACGSSEAGRYAKEAQRAGLGGAVTYEAFSAGLPNSDVRAHVEVAKVSDPATLVELLQSQRLFTVEMRQPDGRESSFMYSYMEYLPVFFDALKVDARLPDTTVTVGGASMTIKGDLGAHALREAAPIGARLDKVYLGESAQVQVFDGLAEPERLAEAIQVLDASPYPVNSMDWDRGITHLEVIADERPDAIDPAEFAWTEPYLSEKDPRVMFSRIGERGNAIGMPPNFPLR